MQRWIRRAVGVAALGGGLLALTGTAHADERSTATQVARTPAAHAGVAATVQVDLCIRLGRCGSAGSTNPARPAPGSGRSSGSRPALRRQGLATAQPESTPPPPATPAGPTGQHRAGVRPGSRSARPALPTGPPCRPATSPRARP